jgi:hypothetical protein
MTQRNRVSRRLTQVDIVLHTLLMVSPLESVREMKLKSQWRAKYTIYLFIRWSTKPGASVGDVIGLINVTKVVIPGQRSLSGVMQADSQGSLSNLHRSSLLVGQFV